MYCRLAKDHVRFRISQEEFATLLAGREIEEHVGLPGHKELVLTVRSTTGLAAFSCFEDEWFFDIPRDVLVHSQNHETHKEPICTCLLDIDRARLLKVDLEVDVFKRPQPVEFGHITAHIE